MNPFFTLTDDPFLVGDSNLHMFLNRPSRLDWGMIFICIRGKAIIDTGAISYDISVDHKATLLPGTIFTVQEASDDFKVTFIAFSHTLFEEAHFRLGPSFIHFLREHPVYHMPPEKVKVLLGLFVFLNSVYQDSENQFRYEITRNQLQCMFWETYDKSHRHFEFSKEQPSFRYQEIFRKFISLIRSNYKDQREVSFYANQLCITPRYLSFITRQMTHHKSAKDMINNHIILEIKVMLQSTQMSIQEIANKLNFPDQSYLGRYFKRYTGKSPSEYRILTKDKIPSTSKR